MTSDKRRAPAGAAVLRGDITRAIRRALMQELAAVGYGRLSIEAVARRAGVSKTAIYRRWSSKLDLVLEIVAAAAGSSLPPLDTGSLRGDLALLLRSSPTRCGTRWPRRSSPTCWPRRPATRHRRDPAEVLRAKQQEIGGSWSAGPWSGRAARRPTPTWRWT